MFLLHHVLAALDSAGQLALNLFFAALGGFAVWVFQRVVGRKENAARQAEAERLVADAHERAAERLKAAEVEAKQKVLESLAHFEQETAETRNELKAVERRLDKREDTLEKKMDVLATKERKIEAVEGQLAERDKALIQKAAEADELLSKQRSELLRIARLTPEQAKAVCLRQIELEVEREAGEMVERIITNAEDNAREKARYITISAIQRYAA